MKHSKDSQLTSEEVAEISKVFANTTAEYILTSDSTRAVLQQKQYLGKEKLDNINTYRYEITVNKQNAQKYCVALASKLNETSAFKKLNQLEGNSLNKETLEEDCNSSTKELFNDQRLDLWIDRRTKLIHKIRVTQNNDRENWVEFSQNYSGGDEINFVTRINDGKKKTTAYFNATSNLKTNITKGTIEAKSDDSNSKYNIKLNLEIKP